MRLLPELPFEFCLLQQDTDTAAAHAARLLRTGDNLGAGAWEGPGVCQQQLDGGREQADRLPRAPQHEGGEGRVSGF